MTVRVLLADDHPLFLDGLRLLLSSAGLDVVGAVTDGQELVEMAGHVEADVVVLDLDMPGWDGVRTATELARHHPHLAVLMLTMHADLSAVRSALRAGARGYIVKGAAHGTVVRAVLAAAEGDSVLSAGMAEALVTAPEPARGPAFGLTHREQDLLLLIARGHGNAWIARELHLSIKTVQNHVSNIFAKLNVTTRAEAVARARDAGIGPEDP